MWDKSKSLCSKNDNNIVFRCTHWTITNTAGVCIVNVDTNSLKKNFDKINKAKVIMGV